MNIILLTPQEHKVGPATFEPEAYFPTVGHALKYLVDREVKTTALRDLAAVNAKIKELHQLIDRLGISKWSYRDLTPATDGENASSNEFEGGIDQNPQDDANVSHSDTPAELVMDKKNHFKVRVIYIPKGGG